MGKQSLNFAMLLVGSFFNGIWVLLPMIFDPKLPLLEEKSNIDIMNLKVFEFQ